MSCVKGDDQGQQQCRISSSSPLPGALEGQGTLTSKEWLHNSLDWSLKILG